jgi:RHS repeat-associated protein
MSKAVNGVTKKFGYDGVDLILEMNDKDSILADYTHSPGIDNPLMMNRAKKNYYYAKDGLGSVTALTDSTGAVVHEYKYLVFGNVVEETGENVENPFTYTSRELDRETGLMFYRARYYKSTVGRFISEDPIGFSGGDFNLYRYVGNSAATYGDPSGTGPVLTLIIYGAELLHYNRNVFNQDVSYNVANKNWVRMFPEEAIYHRMGPGNENNEKYVSPDIVFQSEAVFNSEHRTVTDPANMASFNFFLSKLFPLHFYADMLPYYIWGNSPDDSASLWERLTASYKGSGNPCSAGK